MILIAVVLGGIISIYQLYKVKKSGVLVLENSWGVTTITREADTEIPHIRGRTLNSMVYG